MLPARSARAARSTVQPKAIAGQVQEVAQVAESAAFIFGVSGVMVAMTLIVSAAGWPGRGSAAPAGGRARRPCTGGTDAHWAVAAQPDRQQQHVEPWPQHDSSTRSAGSAQLCTAGPATDCCLRVLVHRWLAADIARRPLLQGLAFGFVLLRVESLAEEGKVRARAHMRDSGRQAGRLARCAALPACKQQRTWQLRRGTSRSSLLASLLPLVLVRALRPSLLCCSRSDASCAAPSPARRSKRSPALIFSSIWSCKKTFQQHSTLTLIVTPA